MNEDDSGIDNAADDAADDAADAVDGALTGDVDGGTELADSIGADDGADDAGDAASDAVEDAADAVADLDGDADRGAVAAAGAAGAAAAGAAANSAKKKLRTSADAPPIEAKPKKERGYGGNNKSTVEGGGAGSAKSGRKDKSSAAVKKVARAAETGSSRDLSMSSRLGFPAIVGVICILGLLLVTYARVTREAEVKPVQNRDHWHAVYGVYDCTLNDGAGGYLPPFLSDKDEEGIHSHQDGIMHVHPWFDRSDGDDAQLVKFFESMNVEVTPDTIVLDTGAVLQEGTDCGGEEAVIHVRKWTFDFQVENEEPEIFTEDIPSIRFLNDREVYIIAFAPLDAEIPIPPAERFETLNSVSISVTSQRPEDLVDLEADTTFEVELDETPAEGTESGE